jgi:kynurenine formamidase
MAVKLIDLSMTTDSDPSPQLVARLTNISHADGAESNKKHWDIDPNDWPVPGNAYSDDLIEMSPHVGTHMDSPWHMGPLMADGSRPKTIDEWPLERCMGPGVVIDIRDVPDGHALSEDEVKAKLREIDYELEPGDIVLVMTGNDKFFGTPEYMTRGGGLSREALKWILDHGITLVGVDAWSFDRPYAYWTADYHKHGRDPKYLWPCHLLALEQEYTHMEKLANLDQLPPYGFTVIAFPIKLARASAAFVRAVALLDS